MKVAQLIEKYGLNNVSNAVILDVGGDKLTGSRSYWINAASLDLSNQDDTNVEIVMELPDMVFIAADGGAWKVTNN